MPSNALIMAKRGDDDVRQSSLLIAAGGGPVFVIVNISRESKKI